MTTRSGHWLTNRVANPVLRRLLRTPLGRRPGRSLAVLRYTGTRTGEPHELVCRYVRDGTTIWVLVGAAERKVWWHSLRRPAEVELWLAGQRLEARAVALVGSERPEESAAGLATYLAASPRSGPAIGLPDGAAPADLADAGRRVVLVRCDITSLPDRATPCSGGHDWTPDRTCVRMTPCAGRGGVSMRRSPRCCPGCPPSGGCCAACRCRSSPG